MVRLISVATLCSLEKIVRNLDMPDSATFIWRSVGDEEPWVLKLEIQNSETVINAIVNYMKSMGISAPKKYEKKRKILASEVNKNALKKTNVEDLKG